MNKTLIVSMNGQIGAALEGDIGLQHVRNTFTRPLSLSLDSGTGDGKADQIYSDQRDLAAGASYTFDLATFNGSNDGMGSPFSMANVKVISVENTQGPESGSIVCGGAPAGARGWTAMTSGTIQVNGTSGFLAYDPGPVGYAVPSGSGNNLFKVSNPGASTVNYRILVIGASA